MTSHRQLDDDVRQQNMALVRQFIDAINDSWNLAALKALISDDFLFVIPFAPEWFPIRYEGREKALAFLDTVRELMEPENLHDVRLDTFASDPAEVVAQYKSDTRMKRTNLPYRNDYLGRFTVRDGQITYFAEYLDPTRFVIALGGTVAPPVGWSRQDAR
jgi:ketosteroid isomerase-like protein